MSFENGSNYGSNSTYDDKNDVTSNTNKIPLTALVVDDDQDARKAFTELLQKYGYETSSVNDGTQAIDMFRSGKQFDVIFLEMKRSLNGLQTTRDLRAIGVHSMIIGFDVFTTSHDYKELRDSGLDRFYEKNVSHFSVALLHNEIEKIKRAAENAED